LPFQNHLQSDLVPLKICAIQGHSKAALEKAGGLFANAAQVYCAEKVSPERKAAFAGVPICPMSDVPKVAYHRTMRSHWNLEEVIRSTLGGPMSTCLTSALEQMGIAAG
jgi:hypothetical protein